jgi:hypothetical protein
MWRLIDADAKAERTAYVLYDEARIAAGQVKSLDGCRVAERKPDEKFAQGRYRARSPRRRQGSAAVRFAVRAILSTEGLGYKLRRSSAAPLWVE